MDKYIIIKSVFTVIGLSATSGIIILMYEAFKQWVKIVKRKKPLTKKEFHKYLLCCSLLAECIIVYSILIDMITTL